MRIATVTDLYETGGAARVACDLVSLWRSRGEVQRFVGTSDFKTGTSYSVRRGQGWLQRFGLHATPQAHQIYQRLRGARLYRLLRDANPDVINVHDIHQFTLPVERFLEISAIAPVVWTLHNAWSCVQDDDQVGEPPAGANSGQVICAASWKDRHYFLDRVGKNRFYAAAPSQWLAEIAVRAGWPEERVSVIPNGLDLEFFSALDRDFARQALNIPADKTCLLFVACDATTDRLKGYHLLDEAFRNLRDRNDLLLLVVGGDEEDRTPSRWILPFQQNRMLLRLYYAAADCCVLPSLVESFGLVLAEAQAMQKPCIAFDVGACREVVEDGETGFLAPQCTAESLVESIRKFLGLDEASRAAMGFAARRRAEARFSIRQQADKYYELFERVVGV